MSASGSERGEGRIGSIIWLLIVIAVIYAGWHLIPAYTAHYTFADKVVELARAPKYSHPDERITSEIIKAGQENHLEDYVNERTCKINTLEVRRIPTGAGRYNIPNIGIFLWRLQANRLSESPAVPVDERRFMMSPLGNDTPLFTRPVTEAGIIHLAQPVNVPAPISRRVLDAHLAAYYGAGRSLLVQADGVDIPSSDVQICNLSDVGGAWAHQPVDKLSIDPVLGRLAFPASADTRLTS